MLKRWIVFGGAIAAALIFSLIWQGDDTSTTALSIAPGKALGVEALMRNVDLYRSDPLLVEGVVSAADTDNQTLALIDVAEFQECGVTDCAALTLPVRWPGPMVVLGTEANRLTVETRKAQRTSTGRMGTRRTPHNPLERYTDRLRDRVAHGAISVSKRLCHPVVGWHADFARDQNPTCSPVENICTEVS